MKNKVAPFYLGHGVENDQACNKLPTSCQH